MIEEYAKSYTTKFILEPIAKLSTRYLTDKPNLYTIFAGLFGVVGLPAVYFGYIYLGIGFFLLSGLLDMLDGAVARRVGKSSDFGAVLDIVSDRLVEFSFNSPRLTGLISPAQRVNPFSGPS